jgi:glycosyltransferase involved in cell wall biosynthesis
MKGFVQTWRVCFFPLGKGKFCSFATQKMNKVKISGVVITFNEEEKIARCINSLWKVCDEVIILDSFSNDSTTEIAEKLNAKVFQHSFDGHIQQKNRAITYANSPFVLSLDADEELSEMLIKSILEVKDNWNCDAYSMNRLNNYGGQWIRYGAWYPDKKLRLWDSRQGIWGGENPHDKYIMSDSSKTAHLKGDLLHYTMNGWDDLKLQTEKFSTIAAHAMHSKGKIISWTEITLKTLFRFIKEYIFLLGFLDGKAGLDIARMDAKYVWLKYAKLKRLSR